MILRKRLIHPRLLCPPPRRLFRNSGPIFETFRSASIERTEDDVDVCIVGAGPAGLSAAIRLKQLEKEKGNEIRVVVLEKGSEVGAHILSGAVIEPRALNELLPSWQTMPGHQLTQPATSSRMLFLTSKMSFPMPHPPQMGNEGNYVVSLSRFTRWLAQIAEEEYGVEIYPGFAGAQFLMSDTPDGLTEDGQPIRSVRGVITNEVGLSKDFRLKSSFEPGMAFRAKVTLLAEGAHGSLSKQAIGIYDLRRGVQPQTYAIGLKEVWRVDPNKHVPGKVIHTMGWPLDYTTYGGGWVYHMDGGLISLGLVIALDYKNPWLSPYREFQRMKHHPYFRDLLSGKSERLAYGARVLNEGGLQSMPKLTFPGGALIGCSAGFVNIAKIKGTHNAMKSGMLAAEAAWDVVQPLSPGTTTYTPADLVAYDKSLRSSWVYDELREVRNIRPSFNTPLGIWGGIAYSGIDTLFLKGRGGWTFSHSNPNESVISHDASCTDQAEQHEPIEYPAFEPPLSTDLMTSVALTGTNHAEDQPVHLRVVKTTQYVNELLSEESDHRNVAVGAGVAAVEAVAEANGGNVYDDVDQERARWYDHVRVNDQKYAGLLGRACPAGVYEYVDTQDGNSAGSLCRKLIISSQNCIHCKLCDVKVPSQDITWTVPEGGGGPKYS